MMPWHHGPPPPVSLEALRPRVNLQLEAAAKLAAAVEARCEYHHLELHNGWAHLFNGNVGRRVVHCRLSDAERVALREYREACR